MATLGVAGCVAMGFGISHLQSRNAERACVDLGAEIDAVWPGVNDTRRHALREAIQDSGLGYADSTWAHLETALDDYTSRWSHARAQACRLSTITGELDEPLRPRAQACLQDKAQRLDARLEAIDAGTESSISRAVNGVHGLPPSEPCTQAQFLRHIPAPPKDPELLEQLADLRRKIAAADAATHVGEFDRGLALVSSVLESDAAQHSDALRVDALLTLANLEEESDRNDDAESHFIEALHLASSAGDDISAAHAATMLVFIMGTAKGDPSAGDAWAETARMLVRRAELEQSPNLGAALLLNLGSLALAKGELEAAERFTREGLELRVEAHGPNHPSLVAAHANLAVVLRNAGKYEASEAEARRSVAIQEQTLGRDHPDIGLSLHGLAASLYEQGRYQESRKIMDEVLANQIAAYGYDSERVGVALMGFAALDQATGDLEAAEKHAREAVAVFEKVLGEDHIRVAEALDTLGNNYLIRERDDDAMKAYQRSIAIKKAAYGPDHLEVAQTLGSMADISRYAERFDEAEVLYDQVLAIQEAKFEPDNPDLAYALVGKGLVIGAQGDHAGAVELLQRAVSLRIAAKAPGSLIAEAEIAMADELWETGRRADSLEAAKTALSRYESLDDQPSTDGAEQVRSWLSQHGAQID